MVFLPEKSFGRKTGIPGLRGVASGGKIRTFASTKDASGRKNENICL